MQAGGGIRAVYGFASEPVGDGSTAAAASAHPARSAAQQSALHHERAQRACPGEAELAEETQHTVPGSKPPGLQRTQSNPVLRRSQRRSLAH